MTFSWFEPTGRDFERRMRAIVDRRARWLEARSEASECIVIVPKSEAATVGFWLTGAGVSWGTLRTGRVQPGTVGFTDERDGLMMGA